MTLALAAAIGVLVGWFGNPLWFRIVDRIWVWRMRRQNRRSPAPSSTLASVAEMYKRLYAPDSVTKAAARPSPSLATMFKERSSQVASELRARKFHVVGAIDGGHAVTYPNAAAEVEAAVAAVHEELAKAAERPEPMLYASQAPGEVVGLAAWIPKSTLKMNVDRKDKP